MDSGNENQNSLTDLLESVSTNVKSDPVDIGDLVHACSYHGFGALLLIPAGLTILPTGAIPGVPAVCGILMALISIQIVAGCEEPWVPKRLKIFSLSKKKLKKSIEHSKAYTEKIDYFLDSRLEFLTTSISQRIVGFITFFLSLLIVVIGFIPFVPTLLAMPILFFALGYSVNDGLLIAIGLFLVSISALWIPFLLSGS